MGGFFLETHTNKGTPPVPDGDAYLGTSPHPGLSLAIGLSMFRIEEGSDDFCGKLRDDGVTVGAQALHSAQVLLSPQVKVALRAS